MGLKRSGVRSTMRNLAGFSKRTTRAMRRVLDQEGEVMAEIAQMNAPVDKHNLEDSIGYEPVYTDHGRKVISIAAGGVVNGVDVDRYALLMHESPLSGNGEKSRRKARSLGRHVGAKYIERAVDERLPETMRKLEEAAGKK